MKDGRENGYKDYWYNAATDDAMMGVGPPTMKTEHTLWKLHEGNSLQIAFEGEYCQVAVISRSSWSEPHQDKTARFRKLTENAGQEILEAVNSHAALVERVKELEETLKADYETMIRMGWGCSTDPLLRRCAETTRAALDAIKE